MIRKVNALRSLKGAKNYPTAHDLERSQLFTQLLSGSLWYVAWDGGYAAPRRPVGAWPLAPAFSCGSLRSPKLLIFKP